MSKSPAELSRERTAHAQEKLLKEAIANIATMPERWKILVRQAETMDAVEKYKLCNVAITKAEFAGERQVKVILKQYEGAESNKDLEYPHTVLATTVANLLRKDGYTVEDTSHNVGMYTEGGKNMSLIELKISW